MKPLDEEEQARWVEFRQYEQAMLKATDTAQAPWYCIDMNDQKAGPWRAIGWSWM